MKTRNRAGTLIVLCAMLSLSLGAATTSNGVTIIDQAAALAGGISGACDAAGFPVTICKPGSYKLTSDLIVPDGADGIDINANDVTIDLNGFAVRGPVSCSGSGLYVSCHGGSAGQNFGIVSVTTNNISIHGGTVRGFSAEGIALKGVGNIVDSIRVSGNKNMGAEINDGILTNSVATLNGYEGFIVNGGQARGNTSNDNAGDGFQLSRTTATQNAAYSNGGYGFNGFVTLLSNNAAGYNNAGDVYNAGGLTTPGNNNCTGNSC